MADPGNGVSQLTSPSKKNVGVLAAHQEPMFLLEAKTKKGKWQNIQDIYPQNDLPPLYSTRQEALAAKAALKTLLLGRWKHRFKKYPIRVRQVTET